MDRRQFALLSCILAPSLGADERSDALEAVEPFATALSDGDIANALRFLPEDSAALRTNVRALLSQATCVSSVAVVNVESDTAGLDWYLRLLSRATNGLLASRRDVVRLRWRKRNIISLEPASFFEPYKP
ncbi:MAG TPA: hypothetical protein VES20_19645 [Bryobacteraceae bacterium]|nr:hypothetical protein [Bryobacteraceae bacterium]